MPKPTAGESQKDFVSRCIPIVMDDGTAKDQKQAAAICYSLYRRHTEKKADLAEFSLAVRAVGLNKKTGDLYWKADTSDVFPDLYDDEMTIDLYRSFLERIQTRERPPAQYCSEEWAGGLPYVSVSHYREHSIAGDSDSVYIDGAILKATGTFRKTKLGKVCFEALVEDMYPEREGGEGRIRISIAFLDYMHKHKSTGFLFERKGLDDVCPECLRERNDGQYGGKIYLNGHLIHFAMTRVPVNQRTLMEVKSMTTRKEDAASIIGEELAEELEGKEKALVGRSDLVIKSEDEETPAVEKMEDGYYRPFGGATTIADARAYIEANKEQQRIGDLMYAFQCVMSNIACDDELEDKGAAIASAAKEFEGMLKDKNVQIFDSLAQLSLLSDPVPAPPNPVLTKLDEIANRLTALSEAAPAPEPPAHPLDESIEQLRSDYDQIMLMEAPAQEKLQQIQGAYSALGARLQQLLAQTPAPTPATAPDSNALLLEVLQKMSDKLDLLTSQRSMPAPAPTAIPRPRSIPASAVPQQPASAPRTGPRSLRSMIEQSVGLESGS